MNKGRKFVFAIVLTLAIFVLASCSIIIDDTHHHLYDENGLCACGDHEASHPELEKYTVSFVDENGKVFESVEVVAGTLVNKPADPSVPGQKFEGWFNGEQEWNFRKHAVVEDTTLTARFTDNAKYEIIYELNGGEFEEGTVLEEEYVSGVGVETLPTPSKEHYVFVGWFINNEQVNGIAPSKKSNVTLVAKWALIEHAISYELNGGSFREGAKIPTEYKETVGLEKLPTPSKTGYTFVSWMIDEKEVSSIAPESLGEVKLVAKWQINEYTITYIVDGKEEVVTYEYDEEVQAPEAPEKEGYSFVGWSEDIPAQMPAENIKLVAKWQINEYTLKINVDGQITEVVYEYNEVVKVPEAPEKEGYSFVKWNNLPSQMPAKDVEVTAEFNINTYTLIINLGNKTQSISYKYNEAVAKLEEPTRPGYIFKGWSSETPEKMPAKNVTITAKWEAKSALTVKEAVEVCKSLSSGAQTAEKFIIEGYVTKVVNTTYGNLYIENEGSEIYIYGLYDKANNRYDKLEVKPEVGDYLKLSGILLNYYGTPEMKNATIELFVPTHKHTVCPECGLCLDADCPGANDEKCAGHEEAPEGVNKADLNTMNGGKASSSYADRESANGWTATFSALNQGAANSSTNANPVFGFLGDANTFAVTLAGGTDKVGKLTSPLLKGGLSKLTFNYTNLFTDTKFSITVNIKDASGKVLKSEVVSYDNPNKVKYEVRTYELEFEVKGDFVIEIVNNCPNGLKGNKDRATIWNIEWVSSAEEEKSEELTVTFDNTEKRTSVDADQQTWEENGVKFVVNKNTSTSAINSNYFNPIRIYKNHEFVISSEKAFSTVKVVVYYNNGASTYIDAFSKITLPEGVKMTNESNVFTIVLPTPVKSFSLVSDGGQVRVVSASIITGGSSEPEVPQGPKEISIAEAIELGSKQESNVYTEEKYIIKGVVKSVSSTIYGNMIITDGVNEILIYGVYSADGETRYDAMTSRPVAGDTVYMLGSLGNYNGTPQMKNGWNTSFTVNHKHEFVNGECACGEKDPNYVPPTEEEVEYVTSVETGVAYYLALTQKNLNKKLYIDGKMSGYYYATVESADSAIQVYLEAANGGYHMYFKDGDTKIYLNIVVSGSYNNVKYENTASSVWTFDEELDTLLTVAGSNTFFLGTYNTFNTFSACKISYASTNFISHLYKVDGGNEAPKHEHIACPTCGLCIDAECDGDASKKCAGHKEEVTAELSFADKANRKEFSTSKQVWTQNGVTLTNNKAKSTSNVADYANPARFYKNSEIIVTATGSMTKIVFTCNNSSYATALKNSIGTVSGATISVSGSKVTVTFASAVESFTVSLSGGQVRMNSLEVTLQSK